MSTWVSSGWYETIPHWIDSGPSTAGLFFDWTGGGFGSGADDDATANLVGYTIIRGSDPVITGAATPGSMVITLN